MNLTATLCRGAAALALLVVSFGLMNTTDVSAQPETDGEKPKYRAAQPFVAFHWPSDTAFWYTLAPFEVGVTLGPERAEARDVVGARIRSTGEPCLFEATVPSPPPGTLLLIAESKSSGMVARDTLYITTDIPTLRSARFKDGVMIDDGMKEWAALTATVGQVYKPTSNLFTFDIPYSHYQTIVTIRGREVFNRAGLRFDRFADDAAAALTIAPDTKPEDILTRVFWKPGGTNDESKWVLLLCNQPGHNPAIPLGERRMTISH